MTTKISLAFALFVSLAFSAGCLDEEVRPPPVHLIGQTGPLRFDCPNDLDWDRISAGMAGWGLALNTGWTRDSADSQTVKVLHTTAGLRGAEAYAAQREDGQWVYELYLDYTMYEDGEEWKMDQAIKHEMGRLFGMWEPLPETAAPAVMTFPASSYTVTERDLQYLAQAQADYLN